MKFAFIYPSEDEESKKVFPSSSSASRKAGLDKRFISSLSLCESSVYNDKMPPNLNEEKKLWKRGFKRVACLDEVGRGCLAGPVMAAAVMIKPPCLNSKFKQMHSKDKKLWKSDLHNIKDSKKLTPKKREEFYKLLRNHPAIKWGLGSVSEKVIDKINILEATKLAMEKAVRNLESRVENRKLKVDFMILDGNMKINLPIPQKSIVKADEKVFSVALASIIAKVTRDRLMSKYAKKYPHFGFDKHKGYATKIHFKMLKKYGHCEIHRQSFRPIKTCKLK